eukprot:m.91240 g.91240  ORF g.91240 m.91240 type:complete len:75 (-) comp12326_c0_seq4:1929-2153(-)
MCIQLCMFMCFTFMFLHLCCSLCCSFCSNGTEDIFGDLCLDNTTVDHNANLLDLGSGMDEFNDITFDEEFGSMI